MLSCPFRAQAMAAPMFPAGITGSLVAAVAAPRQVEAPSQAMQSTGLGR